jgi:hypothetical protein
MNSPHSHHEPGSGDPHGQWPAAESAFTSTGHPVDPELNQIDVDLARMAHEQAVPEGLADRIYQASVDELPVPNQLRGDFQETRQSIWRTPIFARLAMAAAVGLAFIVAVWAATESIPNDLQSSQPMLASSGEAPSIILFSKPIGPQQSPLTRTGKAVFVVSREEIGSPVSQLMETDRMSYSDLVGDMATIIEEASNESQENGSRQYELMSSDLGI